MQIVNLKANHMVNPLGFDFQPLLLSYNVENRQSQFQHSARIEIATDPSFEHVVHDSGWCESISSLGYKVEYALKPRTRYYWRVNVQDNIGNQSCSDVNWFETAKQKTPWRAKWIGATQSDLPSIRLSKTLPKLSKPVKQVRAYVSGLGLYELFINDCKANNEYLTPGCNAYDSWIQYQTYDLTQLIDENENRIEVLLGNGWYKGRFGFNQGGQENHYGDAFELIAEVIVTYIDGSEEIVCSDESWHWSQSPIRANNIYDGERYDATILTEWHGVQLTDQNLSPRLQARKSLPIVIHQRIKPQHVIELEDGSIILDFGENIVGWVEFDCELQKCDVVTLSYAEVMQNGDIFTDNLRTAQAQFEYVSNGQKQHVRPHFTFYGFRYVKVQTNAEQTNIGSFEACFIYSDMEQTATLTTGNPNVNQFVANVVRSHKDNFVDIPTDCPQRDERMGWTGDLQVFSSAACMNMDIYAFLTKYLYDLQIEQQKMSGAVPFVVPMFDVKEAGSCAWGDAATIVPWNLWLHYGDLTIIETQYESMKNWVDYITKQVNQQPQQTLLWDSGFHFGDWLALDNEPHIKTFKGKTEDKFVASIYYHYSALLVAKSASLLGNKDDERHYQMLSNQVLQALRDEYLTANGKLALDTQTAYILAIMFDIYPQDSLPRAAKDIKAKLARDQYKITSGFVGTPYFCRALTKVGLTDIAYRMFLSEEKPSWLYAVSLGATSIWERWDSIDEQGIMNPDNNMNSLNHYAFGSVIDWLYKDVCGLNPVEIQPGFKRAYIMPKPDYRLKYANLKAATSAGTYHVNWQIEESGMLCFEVTIPFDCQATLVLPDISNIVDVQCSAADFVVSAQQQQLQIELCAGNYQFKYQPERDYIPHYHIDMSLLELQSNPETQQVLVKHIPDVMALPFLGMLENESLVDIAEKPFFRYPKQILNTIQKEVSTYVVG